MEVIGIGNIVCDIYYQDKKIIGINGGKSWSNVIFNLANMGIRTKVIGNCGNNPLGLIALDSLINVGIDTSNIKILDLPVNLFHINISNKGIITKKSCPICGNKNWNEPAIKFKLNNKTIVIIDSLQYLLLLKNQNVILDIGYPNELKKLTENQMNIFLNYPFEILNLNNRVAKFLITKFSLKSIKDLYKKLNTKLLIITRGRDGVTYFYDNNQFNFKLTKIEEEIDPNGAGDMFLASTIKNYIENNYICNEDFIIKSFKDASELSRSVVRLIGARTYYQGLYRLPENKECLCYKRHNN